MESLPSVHRARDSARACVGLAQHCSISGCPDAACELICFLSDTRTRTALTSSALPTFARVDLLRAPLHTLVSTLCADPDTRALSSYEAVVDTQLNYSHPHLNWYTSTSDEAFGLSWHGRCLLYHRIYKAGNNAIIKSLRHAADNIMPRSGSHAQHGMLANKIVGGYIGYTVAKARQTLRCPNGTFSFTFVRNPLQHFLSGFAEYYWRIGGGTADSTRGHHRLGNCTRSFALRELERLLHGESPGGKTGYLLRHLARMSGVFKAGSAIEFVGKLEHAKADWAIAMAKAGIAPLTGVELTESAAADGKARAFDATHASSSDPNGARGMMSALLTERKDLLEQLCNLLYVDYVVFGYDTTSCYAFRGA